jgi:hypothetical protein
MTLFTSDAEAKRCVDLLAAYQAGMSFSSFVCFMKTHYCLEGRPPAGTTVEQLWEAKAIKGSGTEICFHLNRA